MQRINVTIGGKSSFSLYDQEPAPVSHVYKKPSMFSGGDGDTYQTSSSMYGVSQLKAADNSNSYPSAKQSYGPPYAAAAKQVTTFGAAKPRRDEHNIGGDGEERYAVKVHHPPGGGGSLNLFGGPSEPTYKVPLYKPPGFKSQAKGEAAYEKQSYEKPRYSGPVPIYNEAPAYAPPGGSSVHTFGKYDYREEKKKTTPTYHAPASGFTSSVPYGASRQVDPSSLNISSVPKAFGQRTDSGFTRDPNSEKTSVRVQAPPGGKSSIFF